MYKTKKPGFLLTLFFIFYFTACLAAFATDLPIRGIATGESKIRPGDKAPLVIPALVNANKEGKVILLMLGYPNHCPWCDRMERYINGLMRETERFGNRAVFILVQTGHAKFIAPPEEGMKLKEAYGVEGQPWLFIIDKQGIVRDVYKVFAGMDAVRKEIKALVEEGEKDGK